MEKLIIKLLESLVAKREFEKIKLKLVKMKNIRLQFAPFQSNMAFEMKKSRIGRIRP